MAGKAEKTFVAANNHPRGQAPANALELKHLLTRKKVKAPETLVKAYPKELQGITIVESSEPMLTGLEDQDHD